MTYETSTRHVPVLIEEVFRLFADNLNTDSPNFFDGTLGGGGHTEILLRGFKTSKVYGCDRDSGAIGRCRKRLAEFEGRVMMRQGNFKDTASFIPEIEGFLGKNARFDGILLDLGLSSDQLDDDNRGFSFKSVSDLDMRMDGSRGKTALEILNETAEPELAVIFLKGGMRDGAKRLARRVLQSRPIKSSTEFIQLCDEVLNSPKQRRLKGGSLGHHPATVPFQALRIAVNDELNAVEEFLNEAHLIAASGAVLQVITFHSLEDELVTHKFREWARVGQSGRYSPPVPAKGKHLTQSPIFGSDQEISKNPRARSARLRAFKFTH